MIFVKIKITMACLFEKNPEFELNSKIMMTSSRNLTKVQNDNSILDPSMSN